MRLALLPPLVLYGRGKKEGFRKECEGDNRKTAVSRKPELLKTQKRKRLEEPWGERLPEASLPGKNFKEKRFQRGSWDIPREEGRKSAAV